MMKVVMNYYRNLDKTSVQFGFVYFDEREDTFNDEIVSNGGEIFRVPRPDDLVRFVNSLDNLANDIIGKYDILHVHEFYMPIFLIKFQNEAKIKKMIAHAHVTKFSNGNRISSIRNWFFSRFNYWVVDYYMASSKKAGQAIFGKIFENKGVVVNNAIVTRSFHPQQEIREYIRYKYNIKDELVVGHVGNMYPPKNHEFLIDVFSELLKINSYSKLLLVGDGVLKKSLEKKCLDLGLNEKVIFVGKRTDIERYLQAIDVFVFPSIFEGLGIAMIEAQAAGLPCVYSDVIPKEADIVKEQNTAMSLNDSKEKWAKTIANVRRNIPYNQIEKLINTAGYNIELEAVNLKYEYIKTLE